VSSKSLYLQYRINQEDTARTAPTWREDLDSIIFDTYCSSLVTESDELNAFLSSLAGFLNGFRTVKFQTSDFNETEFEVNFYPRNCKQRNIYSVEKCVRLAYPDIQNLKTLLLTKNETNLVLTVFYSLDELKDLHKAGLQSDGPYRFKTTDFSITS